MHALLLQLREAHVLGYYLRIAGTHLKERITCLEDTKVTALDFSKILIKVFKFKCFVVYLPKTTQSFI